MWDIETEGVTERKRLKDRSGRKRDMDGRENDRMRDRGGKERTISRETEVVETQRKREREREREREIGIETGVREK